MIRDINSQIHTNYFPNASTEATEISLENLSAGIYFVAVNANGNRFVEKLKVLR